jgi:hypothetical protein
MLVRLTRFLRLHEIQRLLFAELLRDNTSAVADCPGQGEPAGILMS